MVFWLILLFFYGAVIGSFLNVVIDRLPAQRSIIWGRSECDYCRRKLNWYELIPIISYLVQRGCCRSCKQNLSRQYILVEVLTGLITLTYYWLHRFDLSSVWYETNIYYLLFLLAVIVIFVVDLKEMIIPDEVLIFLSIVFGIKQILLLILGYSPVELLSSLVPGMITAFGLSLFFGFLIVVTKGKGMGGGDLKFSFVLGLFLGYLGFLAIYIAFLVGGIYALFAILFRKVGLKKQIPFGPFMAIGIITVLYWGEEIIKFYLTHFT